MKFLVKYRILIIILIVGFFLRVNKFDQLFAYGHDQDLIGWFIRDVLENHHLRLVGQETSSQGVFIGPLFYYLLIPFYFIAGMDPIGGIWFSVGLSLVTIASFYFVFSKIFDQHVGLITSFLYSISFYTVFTDREVVPTQSAMLWTVWFLYALFLFLNNKQRLGFIISGILIGLTWHINLALVLVTPLIPLVLLMSKKRLEIRSIFLGGLIALMLLSPLIIFEYKHGFIQTNSIISSLTTEKGHVEGTGKGIAKFDRTMQLVNKNTNNLFLPFLGYIRADLMSIILVLSLIYLYAKKIISKNLAVIFVLWQVVFIIFFTLNPINISEYYINGMNVIWIGIFALLLNYLDFKLGLRFICFVVLGLFASIHIYNVLSIPIDASGYVQKKAIVSFIKEDSIKHNYPCISISYITSPGRELGYRYFYWLEKMHVNQSSSRSPVYTIVFPHSKVDRIDRSFGALGVIFPEYTKYSQEEVNQSCSGQNSNLTDPLFGFTL